MNVFDLKILLFLIFDVKIFISCQKIMHLQYEVHEKFRPLFQKENVILKIFLKA